MKIVLATVLAAVMASPALAMDKDANADQINADQTVAKTHKKPHMVRVHKPIAPATTQGTGHDRGERGDSGVGDKGASDKGGNDKGGGGGGGGGKGK